MRFRWPTELASTTTNAEALREAVYPVIITADGFEQLALRQLRLWRDVYYLPPTNREANGIRLASDEFYLLGDNSPFSADSRTDGPVRDRDIIGRTVPQATLCDRLTLGG